MGCNALLVSYIYKAPTGINCSLLLWSLMSMINDMLKNISRTFGVPSWAHSLILPGSTKTHNNRLCLSQYKQMWNI